MTWGSPSLRRSRPIVTPNAKADATNAVSEAHEGDANERHVRFIPVIAHQWRVNDFMITDNIGGNFFPGSLEAHSTKAVGLIFRFSRFDEVKRQFDYIPDGALRGNYDFVYAPNSCVAHGSELVPGVQWPGQLSIDGDLSEYEALVNDQDEPRQQTTITCMGQPIVPVQWGLEDLQTIVSGKQKPQMEPSDTKLTGLTTSPGVEADETTTWQWTFTADVPRHP